MWLALLAIVFAVPEDICEPKAPSDEGETAYD